MNKEQFEKVILKLLGKPAKNQGRKRQKHCTSRLNTPQNSTSSTPEEPPVFTYNAEEFVRKFIASKMDNITTSTTLRKEEQDVVACKTKSIEILGVNESNVAPKEVNDRKKTKRKQFVTVTGAKNAQLICIKDEGPEEEPLAVKEVSFSSSPTPKKPHKSSLKSNTKTNRMQRKPLTPLPNREAIDIIQYKLEFGKFTKKNHMYKKTSKIQPWILLQRISDRLLEELLMEISTEIEQNHMLDGLYRSELQ